jgi:hypothetical protein
MAAVSGWKQKGQKVRDIDPLSIPKYTVTAHVSQGFWGLFGMLAGKRKKRAK